MNCHECAGDGIEARALGVCRFCFVGLCKEHLMGSYRSSVMPQYSCSHRPWQAFKAAAQPVAQVAIRRDA